MKKMSLSIILVLILATVLSACGGSGGGDDANVTAGKDLFAQTVIGSQAGCSTCHSLQAGTVIVGPSMAGIGTRAASTVAGQSAEDYIRESILNPEAHLVEGFPSGTMPKVWESELSATQLDQLVAYLLTLK
jgi:nitric oxide reductase subunit C